MTEFSAKHQTLELINTEAGLNMALDDGMFTIHHFEMPLPDGTSEKRLILKTLGCFYAPDKEEIESSQAVDKGTLSKDQIVDEIIRIRQEFGLWF
jgi:hypothetical protein